jgi:hypothetical protein
MLLLSMGWFGREDNLQSSPARLLSWTWETVHCRGSSSTSLVTVPSTRKPLAQARSIRVTLLKIWEVFRYRDDAQLPIEINGIGRIDRELNVG